MKCSCPDWATMCKHIAAVLYGVGARLDARPELLFTLRQVDHLELLTAGAAAPGRARRPEARAIASSDLGSIFGIEIDMKPEKSVRRPRSRPPERAPAAPTLPSRGRRLSPRGPASVDEVVDRIIELLRRNKRGLRAEQIRAALGLEAKALSRSIAAALAAKKVRTTGRTRATTYFAV
jgi:uncharacterized Zn finger protein